MVARGELVGSVYVNAYVNGDGMEEEIERELRNVDGDEEGRRLGRQIGRAEAREIANARRRQVRKSARDDLKVATDTIKKTRKFLQSSLFKVMAKDLQKAFGDGEVGKRLVEDLRTEVKRANIGEDFFKSDSYSKWLDSLVQRQLVHERDIVKINERMNRRIETFRFESTRRIDRAIARIDTEQMNRRLQNHRTRVKAEMEAWDQEFANIEEAGRRREELDKRNRAGVQNLIESLKRLEAAQQRISKGQSNTGENLAQSLERTRAHLRDVNREMEIYGKHLESRDQRAFAVALGDIDIRLRRINPRWRRFNGHLEALTPRIGRMFGRGARNDAVNFFGALTEGITRVVFTIPRMAEALVGFGQGLKESWKQAESFGKFVSLGMARVTAGMRTFGASLASLGIAVPVVVLVLGTLVSVLSLLLGVVTALASTIYFALIGAIGALVGAILPAVAGIGVLVAGIASMSDAQKKALSTAIKPFVSGMKEIGRSAADVIFGGTQFTNTIQHMTRALTSSNMKGLVDEIARAIGNVGNSWAKSLDSPGFQKWLRTMTQTLPRQIEMLGEATRNAFAGMGGVFVALQPLVNRFLTWLTKITDEFANWANSAEGQEKMVRFFDKAGDSAAALGRFLGDVVYFLNKIFTAGADTGNSIFDSMGDSLREFADWLSEEGRLEQWFEDAKDFAYDLGNAIVGIGKALDALDSAPMRALADSLMTVVEAVAWVLESITNLVLFAMGQGPWFDAIVEGARVGIEAILGFLGGLLEGVVASFNGIVEGVGTAFGAIGGVIEGFLAGSWATLQATWQGFVEWVTTTFTPLGEFFGWLFGTIGEFFAGFFSGELAALQAAWGGAVDFMKFQWIGLNDTVQEVGEWINSMGKKISDGWALLSQAWASDIKKVQDAFGKFGDFLDFVYRLRVVAAQKISEKLSKYLAGPLAGAMGAAKAAGDIFGKGLQWVEQKLKGLLRTAQDVARKIKSLDFGSIGAGVRAGMGSVIPWLASGAIVNGKTTAVIGEAGPEAVVPLNRPLSQVDPSVRWLSALAQGKPAMAAGGIAGGRSVQVGDITVVTPSKNPEAVARETIDQIVGGIL